MERTLVILKPDSVKRWLVWEIITRFEKKWLKLVACKMTILDEDVLREHYSHLVDKPFFKDIINYMTSWPVILQVWEWKNVIEIVRLMIWPTDASKAPCWTIRWDFALHVWRNVIHASENSVAAEEEIKRFFKEEEIYNYKRADEDIIYE